MVLYCSTTLAYGKLTTSGALTNNVVIKFRRNYEALLAAALTGFTWSSVGLVDVGLRTKNNLIIRASQDNHTGILNTYYPTMQIWIPILASCPNSDLLVYPQFGVLSLLKLLYTVTNSA